MKKTFKYIFTFAVGVLMFTSCEDPYANQTVAAPGSYEQESYQDTTGFVVVVKSGISPLTIASNNLSDSLSILTCTSVLTLADTAATTNYKIEFSNSSDFASIKTIPLSYNGMAGSDVKVSYKDFNDSIKGFNKDAVQRTVYVRLLAFIVNGGVKTVYTSSKLPLDVTPYSYPPLAVNDVATLPMNSSIDIPVTSNDTDPEGDMLTVVSTTNPTNGSVTINSDGTVKYTPTTDFSGVDNFNYTISDGNGNTSTATVDITILAVNPYYSVTLRPWYLVGEAIGNGSWNNSASGLGAALYPLSVVEGNKYNTSGDGEYTFTGYFAAGKGFKLIRDVGDWTEQWGMSGGVYTHNTGDNISVSIDGYYTINLNSITNTLTIVPATAPTASFTSMGLIGEMNGWGGDIAMTPGQATNNHIWYTTYTFTTDFTPPVGNGGMKFRANGGWDNNWGAGYFPAGLGTNGGTNIPFKAGTYVVIFNDIDGNYSFIKQ